LTVSSTKAPGSATRNGSEQTARTPANQAAAPSRRPGGTISARKGTATTANCLSSTAAARAAAAERKRPRVTRAKASTTPSMLGASFWPNQADLTAIGLAASRTPITNRHDSGARISIAAPNRPSVHKRTNSR